VDPDEEMALKGDRGFSFIVQHIYFFVIALMNYSSQNHCAKQLFAPSIYNFCN